VVKLEADLRTMTLESASFRGYLQMIYSFAQNAKKNDTEILIWHPALELPEDRRFKN